MATTGTHTYTYVDIYTPFTVTVLKQFQTLKYVVLRVTVFTHYAFSTAAEYDTDSVALIYLFLSCGLRVILQLCSAAYCVDTMYLTYLSK